MRTPVLLASCFVCLATGAFAQNDFYSLKWTKVYGYEYKDLPKSALATVDTIYRRAKSENNVQQFTKALLYQSKFALLLNDNAELHVVDNFIRETAASKPPQKDILESMLANIYWSYFKQNRHKYYERTNAVEGEKTPDFRLWDAATMLQTIDRHLQASLENKELLKKVSLTSISDILAEGEDSKIFRPTLFDLLANNAIDFYGEKGNWEWSTDSLAVRKVNELYQSLAEFHKVAKDTTAFVNVSIEYIDFQAGSGKINSHERLKRFYALRNTFIRHDASTLADFEIANILYSDGSTYEKGDSTNRFKIRDALLTCDSAMARFPKGIGAKQINHLRDNILNPDLRIESEKVIPVNVPALALVEYRNVEQLTFSAYDVSEDQYQNLQQRTNDDSLVLRTTESLRLVKQWTVLIPVAGDYRKHSTELEVPSLPVGRYLLFVKSAGSNGTVLTRFDYSFIQVTNLTLLQTQTGKGFRFQVVDRMSGHPIPKANVSLKFYSDQKWITEEYVSGRDGFIDLDNKLRAYDVTAIVQTEDDHAIFELNAVYGYVSDDDEEEYDIKSILFTDRSIYRPGQTIYFKGILLKIKNDKASIVEGEYVMVSLRDVNYKEVESMRLKSNSFGSFNGEFKIPASGLTGEYSVEVEDDDEESKLYEDANDFISADVDISVEEYKRPTFEVNLKPVTKVFTLGDTIVVTGTAAAFSGSNLSNARAAFRVTRMVSYSHWMYRGGRRGFNKTIVESEAHTDANGEFTIKFPALPDPDANPARRPVFRYEISVDVTDINGETRSASGEVKVGYHLMDATMTIPPVIERNAKQQTLRVSTRNLNGQLLNSKGRVRIYKLQSPTAPLRARPWQTPDIRIIDEASFRKTFPHEAYNNENDQSTWQHGKMFFEGEFDTSKNSDLTFITNSSWEPGLYAAELTAFDPKGDIVTDRQTFNVTDKKINAVADQQLLVFETDKLSYTEDEVIHIRVGSAAKDITLVVDVEVDNKIVKTFVEHLTGDSRELLINAGKAGQKMYLHCSGVVFNSFLSQNKTLTITSGKRMDIETISFRDKIQPGSKETWKFEITGNETERKTAEVLASMYDASLDAFKPHAWDFTIQEPSWSAIYTSAPQSFGIKAFKSHIASRLSWISQSYDQFDWFGFSIAGSEGARNLYRSRLYQTRSNPRQPSKVTMRNRRGAINGMISGGIVDAEGVPIAGVNVLVKGTTRGTITDAKGRYELEAKKGETLVFSFVGYATAEAAIGNKNTIDVLLEEDITELSEVVVVGYGQQVKRELTGSVATVSEAAVPAVDADYVFQQSLAGRVAGISVTEGGRTANILVRGLSSLDQKKVLYVIDGVVVSSANIESSEIAAIQVLKGEAAVSIYGSAAAHGVVVINTKSGQAKINAELAKVNARKNFNETAFFFPQLRTDEQGRVQFTFTSPESLTRWKLNLLAHTRDLDFASETLYTTTQKELMVTPNMARFLRTGDEILLSAKVSNLSNKDRDGKIVLQLTDPVAGTSLDSKFANVVNAKTFRMTAKGNAEVTWKLKIPRDVDAVQYRVVAKAGNFSDGEQNVLPVLSNRMLITETMPMYVRGGEEKTFVIKNLKNNESATLQHHKFTIDVTSNPAWYAIQSLPYLMEFPHECAEQLFSRYYANAIGSYIVNSNPRISAVFNQWKGTDALESNLEKNPELKSILIEETPWIRDAENESDQKKRIALLFDLYTMQNQLSAVVDKLAEMQWSNGAFPWFEGSRYYSRFITQHVASGFGHLRKLNIVTSDSKVESMTKKAVEFLDSEVISDYTKANDLKKLNLGVQQIQYLYMRSFFPEYPVGKELKNVVDYYTHQSEEHWQEFNLYSKAMIAMIHHRNGNDQVAADIIKSLKENSISSEEMGMYWKANVSSWLWNEAPIETQALLIEAFSEISPGSPDITEMQLWLLKNKQTNRWNTTKATTEAVYAILLNGGNWLAEDNSVQLKVGTERIDLSGQKTDAGLGYFKTAWSADKVTPSMGEVRIKKDGDGVAWGGIYWQYFEDIDHVKPSETPLRLDKKVFVVQRINGEETMKEVTTNMTLKTGDLLRVRLTLGVDRDMEFLHLKDQRSSGTEPVDVLSEYHWRDGFGYYQSTKDAATHFFFDSLAKGVYVFEYDLRVNNRGDFANGIASIESMYAPEFSSHTASVRVKVE